MKVERMLLLSRGTDNISYYGQLLHLWESPMTKFPCLGKSSLPVQTNTKMNAFVGYAL